MSHNPAGEISLAPPDRCNLGAVMHALPNRETVEVLAKDLPPLAVEIHQAMAGAGFWPASEVDPLPRRIALFHTELSEAFGALAMGDPPDEKTGLPSSFEVEIADFVIRVLDTLGLSFLERDANECPVPFLRVEELHLASQDVEERAVFAAFEPGQRWDASLIQRLHWLSSKTLEARRSRDMKVGGRTTEQWMAFAVLHAFACRPNLMATIGAKMAYNHTRQRQHGKRF